MVIFNSYVKLPEGIWSNISLVVWLYVNPPDVHDILTMVFDQAAGGGGMPEGGMPGAGGGAPPGERSGNVWEKFSSFEWQLHWMVI